MEEPSSYAIKGHFNFASLEHTYIVTGENKVNNTTINILSAESKALRYPQILSTSLD